ncbi:hypothetical protein SAMN02746064_00159 [Alkalibacter saccharofermentans DSM 14828]|uniref:DUF7305 domain-containing protein n=2 Tax=Alkalibacter TaxID=274470 RepID=A0A1M4S903_9FIRM|nr:hypothetical protein SAMN02746064_00159 [Alkalibacter saccharofermentans DSM 14828]
MVLPTVIIIGAIVIMTGVVLLSTGVVDVKGGLFVERNAQAYQTAKSAADSLGTQIVDGDVELTTFPANFTGSLGDSTYDITVTKSGNFLVLESTGQYDNVSETATLYVEESIQTDQTEIPLDMAVFSDTMITLIGGASIEGSVGTNSTTDEQISLSNNSTITGTVWVGAGGDPENVIKLGGNKEYEGPTGVLPEPRDYPTPSMPEAPEGLTVMPNGPIVSNGVLSVPNNSIHTITLDDSYSLTSMSIGNGSTLTINIGSNTREIRMGSFVTNGTLIINGTGTLKLYVDNTLNLNSSSETNWNNDPKEPEKLEIYYYGSSKLTINATTKFCGHLQVNNAEMDLNGSGNLTGTIVSSSTKNIKFSGNNSSMDLILYAPLAEIELTGTAQLKGAVVADTVKIGGGGTIIYGGYGNTSIPGVIIEGETNYVKGYWK